MNDLTTRQNWSGAVHYTAADFQMPRNVEDVAACITNATTKGRAIRVIGSGHSFNPFWQDNDVVLDLRHLNHVGERDENCGVIEIGAGMPLHQLGEPLWAQGCALANMGDIDRQTLAGAVSTGTHGTGTSLGSLSTQVAGIKLVNGLGEVHWIRDEGLKGAALSFGALGVVCAIELQVVQRYGLLERQWQCGFAETLTSLDAWISATRHFEFFYAPRADICYCKSLESIAAPVEAVTVPEIAFGEPGERQGASFRIFPSQRDQRFNEMEFSVPRESAVHCMVALRELLRTRHPKIAWPVEFRTVRADDLWLSPNQGRDSVTLSIHEGAERSPAEFFRDAQEIFLAHDGRPHWGKMHFLTASELRTRYPDWDKFQTLRDRHDPQRRLSNSYVRQLLGA